MTKIIKIESCAGCEHKFKYHMCWVCYKTEDRHNISSEVINKTIHPDCPLDDEVDMRISLMPLVPQQFGEAVSLYPWINCQTHEWDNRTTLENTIWLLGKLKDHSLSDTKELEEYAQALQYAMASEKKINVIKRDATKHIRKVSDWKPIINPYDFDVDELAILHNGLLEKIKADLNNEKGGQKAQM